MENLEGIFQEIKAILEKHSTNLLAVNKYRGSQAKTQKPAYHLYGKKEISLFGKKPQQTYIAGVIQQKNYVSFYFSPIYSHPDEFQNISPELAKFLKGKSCFNLTTLNQSLTEEINALLKDGIDKYREINWI